MVINNPVRHSGWNAQLHLVGEFMNSVVVLHYRNPVQN